MIVKFPDGTFYLVHITAMHRRRCIGGAPYSRITDWIAQAGPLIRWGRTRRDALANLKDRSGAASMIDANARATVALLCERFPKTFFMFELRRRPLKDRHSSRYRRAAAGAHSGADQGSHAGVCAEPFLSQCLYYQGGRRAHRSPWGCSGRCHPEEAANDVKSVAAMTAKWKANKAATKAKADETRTMVIDGMSEKVGELVEVNRREMTAHAAAN
jgi:hypothetical protein